MQDKGVLKFSFDGGYEVNALALSCAIVSLVDISKKIADSEFPNVDFKMTVCAVRPGSLEFEFCAEVSEAFRNMFTKENLEFAGSLLGAVAASFEIKKFLQGRKPQKVEKENDKIVITRQNGDKIEAPKEAALYFSDVAIDQSVTNLIRAADLSSETSGITVQVSQGEVTIPREDFEGCSNTIDFEAEDRVLRQVRRREVLYVRQASFTDNLQWRFTGDQKIRADVLDMEFMERVKAGEINVNSKTYLVADVEVIVPLGKDGLPSGKQPTYNVLKVHEVHTAAEEVPQMNI